MCRAFSQNDQLILMETSPINFSDGKSLEKKVFEGLLKESLSYIQAKSVKISESLLLYEKKFQKDDKKDGISEEIPKFKNYLNNMLLLDILQLLSKLLSFNTFHLIQQEETFITLFPNLISLLEFDFLNPLISLSIVNKREKGYKDLAEQEKKKQNIMSTGFSGIKNLFSDVMENVTGLTKEMAGTLLGQTSYGKNIKDKSNVFLDRYNETFLYSHPLMRSCVSQRNKLSLLVGDEEGKVYKVEKDLKILIIDIMKRFLAMRHDFLITNFIAFYQEICKKEREFTEEKIKNEISNNFMSVLPEILKVGISFLDFKYQIKEEQNVLNNVGTNFKNLVGNIGNLITNEEGTDKGYLLKKFRLYTKEKEIADFDNLLTGPQEEQYLISKTLYPSLIMMFYTSQDPSLECKFLEIIMKCFHQRVKFAESLENLELLFDKADIENYLHISRTVKQMQSICEKTEVWISDWLLTGVIPEELAELKKIVNFLIVAFHSKSVESKLEIEEIEKEEDQETIFQPINAVRQKMAFFLGIHLILIDFLKDTMHLTEKILKDELIELKDKELFLSLYKKVFLWMKYFARENLNNQQILYENLTQFVFHMDLDLGQTDLICEIFRNNQNLCENIKMKIIVELLSFIHTIGRREKFLSLFEVLQTCNNSYIFETQAKIVNAFLGNSQISKNIDKLSHILYVKPQNDELVFDFDIKPLNYYFSQNKNNNSYKTQFAESLYGDKPYKYHAKLLRVLSLSGQGIQGFNLSNARLRKLFNLPFIFITLSKNDNITISQHNFKKTDFWEEVSNKNLSVINDDTYESPFSKKLSKEMKQERNRSKNNLIENKDNLSGINILKPALINYLLDVYLPTIKKEKDEFHMINSHVEAFLAYELQRFLCITDQELRSDIFREHFFEGVLRFMVSYTQNIVAPMILVENIEKKDNEILFGIAENIIKRMGALENMLSNNQYKNMVEFVKIYYQENEELMAKMNKCAEEDANRNKMGSQSNMSNYTEMFEEGLDNTGSWKAFIKLCLRSDVLEKVVINKILLIFLVINFNGFLPIFNLLKEIEKEKKALCESFIKIHLMFDEEVKKKYNINIEMKNILAKLVNYVQFAIAHKEDKDTISLTLEILMYFYRFFPLFTIKI